MHEITINLDTLLWCATGLGTVCVAIVWIKKGLSPFLDPFRQIRADIKVLKDRKLSCDLKFEEDRHQLRELREDMDDLKEDMKMIIRSQMLTLKHIETGNCTGEAAEGRKALEEYLINKE